MSQEPDEALERFIHDVNSKCAGLKGVAGMLPEKDSKEVEELLEMMARNVDRLAQIIVDYRRKRRG